MLIALAMLLPVDPTLQGAGLLVLALVNVPGLLGIAYAEVREPRREAWAWFLYRYAIPLVAQIILAAGAIGLIVGWEAGLSAPALSMFLMFIVGGQNAWDLLMGGKRRPGTRPRWCRSRR